METGQLVFSNYGTLVCATLVLLLGRKLVEWISPLRTYSIPEPVAAGLLVALGTLALREVGHFELKFDTSLQTPLMLAFFATIGLSANLASLKAGGRRLVLFLAVVAGMLITQNAIGVGLATLMGLAPGVGLLGGSITLAGGHGTGAAWGETLTTRYGVQSALEIAMACATFGLVLGGLLGGPVARFLVGRLGNKVPGFDAAKDAAPEGFEQPHTVRLITAQALIETVAMIAICLLGGEVIARWLSGTMFEVPTFVCVLFTGVIVRNLLSLVGYEVFDRSLSVMGNVSLSLFLAMALMTLRLWDLSTLALPMIVILVVQAIAMATYAIFVTFRVMGSNYDAAVLAAGHCGFGLGATPTAIANMQAVTERFGPSHIAFLIVPMVGAFFIDILNALIIKGFLSLPLF
ncbi:sodium/glutamate symporter [Pandoraea apista]|uniref:Sodium/glutamate symporter n=1 Tax=Pandoraea apista TaxID=93218 RepID=A0A0B5FB36_9BURK|nr:sodium/glutamate symporter [Pandoraea apista]AJF00561.1 sodium:glutamate symporter [Pandoraea apista]AKH74753.1 sodium:glutamate symporter [Pandoraea apista]AKI61718.1 sodium:glutamate symporter [Pandoraea apista]ALS65218.1 sodium/glutamate symporter [Pandoraea apista]AVF39940.1 sodium/glutamate symporter [Pandoraea apista]